MSLAAFCTHAVCLLEWYPHIPIGTKGLSRPSTWLSGSTLLWLGVVVGCLSYPHPSEPYGVGVLDALAALRSEWFWVALEIVGVLHGQSIAGLAVDVKAYFERTIARTRRRQPSMASGLLPMRRWLERLEGLEVFVFMFKV